MLANARSRVLHWECRSIVYLRINSGTSQLGITLPWYKRIDKQVAWKSTGRVIRTPDPAMLPRV
jgi:hypothetical protein